MYDILFKNARIVDGTGAPWYRSSLAVKDGKIAAIGGDGEAIRVIDCGGNILAPGFIDTHAHYESIIGAMPDTLANLMQGVTTQVCGVCGLTPAPLTDDIEEEVRRYVGFTLAGLNPPFEWRIFEQYLSYVDKLPPAVNFAAYVGHGTLRIAAMGFVDRAPTTDELEKMKDMLRDAMKAGALGMSTGLFYPPGVWSSIDELAALGEVLVEYGGIFASHMRNEGDELVASVEEVLEISRRSGCKLQIHHHKVTGAHNWGLVNKTLGMIEAARDEGIDVTLDQYPYNVSATTLRAVLPPWSQIGGVEETVARLSDPDVRRRIREDIDNGIDGWENQFKLVTGPDAILLFYIPHTPQYQGLNLLEASEIHGKDPIDTALDIIALNNGHDLVGYGSMSDEDVCTVMKSPYTMIGSDTLPGSDSVKCHPRAYGSFARVLARYVREKGIMPLEEAVRKMTSLPAARFGFFGRGVLHVGNVADLVLFDPEKILDTADFKEAARHPEGIITVVVDGKIAVDDGIYTGGRFGRVLRYNK